MISSSIVSLFIIYFQVLDIQIQPTLTCLNLMFLLVLEVAGLLFVKILVKEVLRIGGTFFEAHFAGDVVFAMTVVAKLAHASSEVLSTCVFAVRYCLGIFPHSFNHYL